MPSSTTLSDPSLSIRYSLAGLPSSVGMVPQKTRPAGSAMTSLKRLSTSSSS